MFLQQSNLRKLAKVLMDTTGLVALEDIYQDLNRRGCRLLLSGLQTEVQQKLERSGLLNKIGLNNCFDSTDVAIDFLKQTIKPQGIPVAV
jgi:SulP family sulfate permease